MKNNKKGFTFVEVMVAFVILSLLVGISIPIVSRYVLKGEKNYYNNIENELVTIAKNYYADNPKEVPNLANYVNVIYSSVLEANGYISDKIVDDNGKACDYKIISKYNENTKKEDLISCVYCSDHTTNKEECTSAYTGTYEQCQSDLEYDAFIEDDEGNEFTGDWSNKKLYLVIKINKVNDISINKIIVNKEEVSINETDDYFVAKYEIEDDTYFFEHNYDIEIHSDCGANKFTKNFSFGIDTTAPEIEINGNSDYILNADKNDVLVSNEIKIFDISLITDILYKYDDGDYIKINKSELTLTKNYQLSGNHVLYIKAVDQFGNTSEVQKNYKIVNEIVYNSNGADDKIPTVTKEYNVPVVISSGLTRNNYIFVGWGVSADSKTPIYKGNDVYNENKSLNLYAIWDKKTPYKIVFDTSGGSKINNQNVDLYDNSIIFSDIPLKDGYVFKGWSLINNSTNIDYYPGDKIDLDKDITLYAVWEKLNSNQCVINYNTMGGNNIEATIYNGSNANITSDKPLKIGYNFLGWSDDKKDIEKKYSSSQKFSGDCNVILYAIWKPISYKLQFDLDGGLFEDEVKSDVSYDNSFYVPRPSKSGYVFNGWIISNVNNEIALSGLSDDEIINKIKLDEKIYDGYYKNLLSENGTVKFKANWISNTYNIKFDSNTGEGEMVDQSLLYGVNSKLNANKFKKIGYTFVGWNTKADGSGKTYDDKQDVLNLTTKNGETIILYAQWRVNKLKIYYIVGSELDNVKIVDNNKKVPKFSLNNFNGNKYIAVTNSPNQNARLYLNNLVYGTVYSSGIYNNGYYFEVSKDDYYYIGWYYPDGTYLPAEPDKEGNYSKAEDINSCILDSDCEQYIYAGWANINGTIKNCDKSCIIDWNINTNIKSTMNWKLSYKIDDKDWKYISEYKSFNGSVSGRIDNVNKQYSNIKLKACLGDSDICIYNDALNFENNEIPQNKKENNKPNNDYIKIDGDDKYILSVNVNEVIVKNNIEILNNDIKKILYSYDSSNFSDLGSLTSVSRSFNKSGNYKLIVRVYYSDAEYVDIEKNFKILNEISYDLNGGKAKKSQQEKEYGVPIKLLSDVSRNGYKFLGWATDKNATKEEYSAGVTYSKNESMMLYAVWKKVSGNYSIVFNSNGGKGTMKKMTLELDKNSRLTANSFSKVGNHFVSWNTKANGSGKTYSDKQGVLNLATKNGETITLYAQWAPNVLNIYYSTRDNISNSNDDVKLVDNKTDKNVSYKLYDSSAYKYIGKTKKDGSKSTFYEYIQTWKYGSTYKNGLYNNNSKFKMTRDGYNFIGWFTTASSNDGKRIPADPVNGKYDNAEEINSCVKTKSVCNQSLYAEWGKITASMDSCSGGKCNVSWKISTTTNAVTNWKLQYKKDSSWIDTNLKNVKTSSSSASGTITGVQADDKDFNIYVRACLISDPKVCLTSSKINIPARYVKEKIRLTVFNDYTLVRDFTVRHKGVGLNSKGWRTYTVDGKTYLVIATATKSCSPYTNNKTYNYDQVLKLEIEGKVYDAMILDCCGACAKYSGSKGAKEKIDLWTNRTTENFGEYQYKLVEKY